MIEKCYRPPRRPAWWFLAGHAYHHGTEVYDRHRWEHGLPDSIEKSTKFLLDAIIASFDVEIRKAEKEEPDRTQWMRGGRASKEFPDKEAEKFYRARFPEWAAAYDNHARTSGETIWTTPAGEPAIEMNFVVTFGGVPVKGAIDRIVIHPTGLMGVVDLKTGSRAGNPLQLGSYRAALTLLHGTDDVPVPTYGQFWNPRKGAAQLPAIGLESFTVELYDRLFAGFDAQRKSGHVLFNVGEDCARCQVRPYCPAWGGPQAIPF